MKKQGYAAECLGSIAMTLIRRPISRRELRFRAQSFASGAKGSPVPVGCCGPGTTSWARAKRSSQRRMSFGGECSRHDQKPCVPCALTSAPAAWSRLLRVEESPPRENHVDARQKGGPCEPSALESKGLAGLTVRPRFALRSSQWLRRLERLESRL
jgi:hypothetical protein